jgi:hypothetical protein
MEMNTEQLLWNLDSAFRMGHANNMKRRLWQFGIAVTALSAVTLLAVLLRPRGLETSTYTLAKCIAKQDASCVVKFVTSEELARYQMTHMKAEQCIAKIFEMRNSTAKYKGGEIALTHIPSGSGDTNKDQGTCPAHIPLESTARTQSSWGFMVTNTADGYKAPSLLATLGGC